MKKVLFAASECTPFFKSGGLADVIGSLPKYLNSLDNCEVRVILPLYEALPEQYRNELKEVMIYETQVGWRNQYTGIYELIHDNVHYYFVDNEQYFKRPGLYGYEDDGERFVYFSNAVIEFIYRGDYKPDVLHCHDWQTGAAVAINKIKQPVEGINTVFTIHNMKYQGWLQHDAFENLFNLDRIHFSSFEWGGMLNLMKAALFHANKITTVSPTYAEEIKTAYYGEGLEWMLQLRANDLVGVVNGIDVDDYNSMKDPALPVNYKTSIPKKNEDKKIMQSDIGFTVDKDIPMYSLITRMIEQKGLDLVTHIMEEFLQQNVQLVILGNGEYQYECYFSYLAQKHPDKVHFILGFNESLSRRIYAASDFFIMPSKFEPCGISQLIALQYKTVPIVRETGGLKDTVQPFNIFTEEGTGLTFANYNAHELLDRLNYSRHLYEDTETFKQLFKNICKVNNSWKQSAHQYLELY